MMRRSMAGLAGLCLCLFLQVVLAADTVIAQESMTEQQVLEYLESHPEFLLHNPELLQRTFDLQRTDQQKAEIQRRRKLVSEKINSLLSSELTPVRGPESARHTLIEFSDYLCAPCKLSFAGVEAFIRDRSDVRLIQLQLPIYGPYSIMAARAALIAQSLGHFGQFHRSMMQTPLPIDLEAIEIALASAGVSEDDFENRVSDPALADYLQEVKTFSTELNVIGTPAFLLDGKLINGAVSEKTLQDVLTELQQ